VSGDAAPRWRRRWPWIAGAAALAILVGWPCLLHHRGASELAAARARLEAPEFGGSAEEFLRAHPLPDADRQARWARLQERALGRQRTQEFLRVRETALFGGKAPPPAAEEDAALVAEAVALLGEGPLLTGFLARARLHLDQAGRWKGFPLAGRADHSVGFTKVVHLLRAASLGKEDPGPYLAALDRIEAVYARPGCAMDSVLGLLQEGSRDHAYLALEAAGRLPRAAGDAWLGEDCPHPRRLADAVRGERHLVLDPFARDMETGGIPRSVLLGGRTNSRLEDAGIDLMWWLFGDRAMALALEEAADRESALRRGGPPRERRNFHEEGQAGSIAEMFPSFDFTGLSAGRRAAHGLARLGARALRVSRERGRLPADREELRAWLGADGALLGGPWIGIPVLLERPAPDRLRLRLDPAAPVPPDLGRWTVPAQPRDDDLGFPVVLDAAWLEMPAPLPAPGK
jgi:hypothetical protein